MHVTSRHHRYPYGAYLALEETANVKHEYFDGEIYAMAGGSREHAALAANLIAEIATQTRNSLCRPHSSDLRIRVLPTGLTTYPDVAVVCGRVERDPEDPRGHTVTNPIVLCEVLSPSTEEYDRGEKFDHYRQIASLRHVLFVSHDRRRIELWTRGEGAGWSSEAAGPGERLTVSAIGVELDVSEIYRDPLSPSGYLA